MAESGHNPIGRPVPRRWLIRILAARVAVVALSALPALAAPEGWIRVDYGPLVDRERTAQSGETAGALLDELGGRPVPSPGERPRDFAIHRLLEPILEPYAFVLSDALDTVEPPARDPWVEVAGLWESGEAQPAWVDLFRSRRYVLESDGAGRLRAFLPAAPDGPSESAAAAERAWRDAWPVLRHPVAAERRRLASGTSEEVPAVTLEVRAYRHAPESTRFELGLEPYRIEGADTRPDAGRAPLDLEALARILASPSRLEGGRLEPDGTVRWFTSEADAPPTLLGIPMDLSDAAVAYRAVFHGGLAEPYMSLDKGDAPWSASVGFGGRLRDTRLGAVSLLSDIRFKTFSVGFDPLRDADLRAEIRGRLASFRTHLERFAADAASADVGAQQTRFWFYPDDVEFALSPRADVFAIRRARMSAASERVRLGERLEGAGEDAPWTRDLVEALNRHYDLLSGLFPEMADLDRAVRLLSAFAWLRAAGEAGQPLPDLDVLLAVELPAAPSPRTFPQLLTRDVLPEPGAGGAVEVLDQSWIGEALDRLRPRNGRPSPARRLQRALDLLDPRDPEQAEMSARARAATSGSSLDSRTLGAWTDRAERIAMHRRVLAFAPAAGERARVFSVGIGGIDLGTSSAFARASRKVGGLGRGDGSRKGIAPRERPAAGGAAAPVPGARRDDPPGLPVAALPDHGLAGAVEREAGPKGTVASRETPRHRFARGVWSLGPGEALSWTESRLGSDGPGVTLRRRVQSPEGRPAVFVRVEEGRLLPYRLNRDGDLLRPVIAEPSLPPVAFGDARTAATPPELPPGLVLLEFLPRRAEGNLVPVGPGAEPPEEPAVALRRRGADGRDLAADLPRTLLRRLVVGPRLDPPGAPPVPLFSSPQALLGEAATVLVALQDGLSRAPWEGPSDPVPGEEDALRVAAALSRLWTSEDGSWGRGAAVATDVVRSPRRWAASPVAPRSASLVLPPDAFPAGAGPVREEILRSWPGESGAPAVPAEGSLVVLASAEAPGVLAARLRALARDPAMKGRLLAVCALGGALRPDLPGSLLAEGNLAAVAFAEPSLPAGRRTAREVGAWARALAGPGPARRVESVPGPFVWFY